MQTETKHTAYEGWQERVKDMRAMLALYHYDGETSVEGYFPGEQWERLTSHLGLPDDWGDLNEDAMDAAYALADSYCYGAHVLYERDEDTNRYHVSRVELLLAGGGPTHVLTWDERGGGWSEYMDSWGEPSTCDLSPDEHEMVESFLRAFISSELDDA